MISPRFTPVVMAGCFALAALALYLVKYQVQSVRDEVTALERKLDHEGEALALLQAEWAYLNRPERLEALAEDYLEMQSPAAGVMIGWQELPLKPTVVAEGGAE